MTDGLKLPDDATLPDVADGSLEIWLEHRLRWLYGRIVEEPIPDELLRILEEKPPRR